jgi:hypothetical protein
VFRVSAIHQIEMTSRCNLRCQYCTHPKMPRPKMDMDDRTYRRSLDLAAACYAARPEHINELNLAGIGESTMHPEFVRNVMWAREAMGWDVGIVVATNGLLMTREMAKAIAPARPAMFVSLHRPEKAGPAIEILKEFNLLHGVSADPSIAAVDWAGQVKWKVSAVKGGRCPWVIDGRVFVMADGRVSRCCFDATGEGVIGSIFDDIEPMQTSPYSLCAKCHLDVGVAA